MNDIVFTVADFGRAASFITPEKAGNQSALIPAMPFPARLTGMGIRLKGWM